MRDQEKPRTRPADRPTGALPLCTALMVAAVASAIPISGRSAESVLPITPPGSTDVDQANLPPPGFYGGAFVLPYSADRHTYDSRGHEVPPAYSVHDSTEVFGPAFLYVYPTTLFGGTIGSTFIQPFQNQTASFGTSAGTSNFGTADAYSDLLFWSRGVGLLGATPGHIPMAYGLTFAAAFSLIIPDGQYNDRHFFKLSSHSWVPDPNISFTYNTGPKLSLGSNTQLSTRLFYAIPTRDTSTNYTSGNILDLDYSATEQFGNLRLGVAGYYQAQTTDDHAPNNVPLPNGNRFSEIAVGPIVEYFFPHRGIFIKAKYDKTIYHRNYVDQDFLVLSTGFKF